MSGRPNTAWMETMVRKMGSRDAVADFQRKIGAIGGQRGVSGGFASDKVGEDGLTGRERAMIAGATGGRISRRRKGPCTVEDCTNTATAKGLCEKHYQQARRAKK